DERPAHGWCSGLQFGKFRCEFGRYGFGNRRDHLRDLHDRALEPAKCGFQLARRLAVRLIQPEKAGVRHTRRDAADTGADLRITLDTAAEAVRLTVLRAVLWRTRPGGLVRHSIASSSSMKPRIMESPLSQK